MMNFDGTRCQGNCPSGSFTSAGQVWGTMVECAGEAVKDEVFQHIGARGEGMLIKVEVGWDRESAKTLRCVCLFHNFVSDSNLL